MEEWQVKKNPNEKIESQEQPVGDLDGLLLNPRFLVKFIMDAYAEEGGKKKITGDYYESANFIIKNNVGTYGRTWIPMLFNLARNSRGKERFEYATALSNLVPFVKERVYNEELDKLLSNPKTVQEMIEQGRQQERQQELDRSKVKSAIDRVRKLILGEGNDTDHY